MVPSLRSAIVRKANQVTAIQLHDLIRNFTVNEYDLLVMHAVESLEADRREIWSLLEDNMQSLYSGTSMGWNPVEKQKELFDPLSRFVLYKETATSAIKAFTMFRFEYEEGERLLYCYELQVAAGAQKLGFGRRLIEILMSIGQETRMEKIMLTVFKANEQAYGFYQHLGFVIDACSPTYVEGEEADDNETTVDYHILSKLVR